MNTIGNATSTARTSFHIQLWYDEVEDFDSAESGFVNFIARRSLSYIPFASSTINQIGCGRAIYIVRLDKPSSTMTTTTTTTTNMPIIGRTMSVKPGDRVEVLVCNYGPLDWDETKELYEDGAPAPCPRGTVRSTRYQALCRKFQKEQSRELHHKIQQKYDKRNNRTVNNGAYLTKPTVYLVQLVLLWLARLTIPDRPLTVTSRKSYLILQ